ncbi:MAG: CHASE domain-containing protein [Rhodobiaceae bacterium]|nr:CHASE domain-containing protein [Rhodobiaceae bacterium]
MAGSTGEAKTRGRGSLHWIHWLVLAASLVLTLAAWQFSRSQVLGQANAHFDRQAYRTIELVRERMAKYEEALWAGAAMIRANDDVTDNAHWQAFAKSLRIDARFPGINGIGIIYRVGRDDLDAFLARERAERPDFALHPQQNREDYWPIAYVQPVEINRKAVGLDMSHEANRYAAALEAMDTGMAQISGPVILVQDSAHTPGFVFYAPFYRDGPQPDLQARRENFIGLVYAPFIMGKLMEGTLAQENRDVLVTILDADITLFSEFGQQATRDPDPMFATERTIDMYGRLWRFQIEASKAFRAQSESEQPTIILMSGILIDTLLLAVFFLMSRSNARLASLTEEIRAELATSESRMRRIVGGLAEGVATIDSQGMIQDCNDAFSKIFGFPDNAAQVFRFDSLVQHDDAFSRLMSSVAKMDGSTYTVAGDLCGIRLDGELFPMELSLSKPGRGNATILIALARDVTARRSAENATRELTERLMASNADLERFAYIASHDMQEPLRKILTFSNMLSEAIETGDKGEVDYSVSVILNSAERARKLVQDILAYSTVQKKQLNPDLIRIEDALADSLAQLHEYIHDSGAGVSTSLEPAEVRADSQQLAMLLENLIGNAVKYRRKDVPAKIVIDGKEVNGAYTLSVNDNGIGFDSALARDIVQPFKRLQSRDEYPGSGIGLAICAAVCDRHGWQMRIASAPGEGSIFTIVMPRAASPKPAHTMSQASAAPLPSGLDPRIGNEDRVVRDEA